MSSIHLSGLQSFQYSLQLPTQLSSLIVSSSLPSALPLLYLYCPCLCLTIVKFSSSLMSVEVDRAGTPSSWNSVLVCPWQHITNLSNSSRGVSSSFWFLNVCPSFLLILYSVSNLFHFHDFSCHISHADNSQTFGNKTALNLHTEAFIQHLYSVFFTVTSNLCSEWNSSSMQTYSPISSQTEVLYLFLCVL